MSIGTSEVIAHRNGEARASHHVFRILRNERGGVVAGAVGQFDDFRGAEGLQVDARHAGGIVGVAKYPASVYLAVGLGEFRVMEIVPGNKAMGCVEHGLAFLAVPVPFFGGQRKIRSLPRGTGDRKAGSMHSHLSAAIPPETKLWRFHRTCRAGHTLLLLRPR
ncbi:MAG: hypothetical protein MZV63_72460 [Marinilabiliales bacterium]|nr:hypothetical protein [Marinilabiliales bacterium]